MPAARFEDLVVWQKAHQFVLAVYRVKYLLEEVSKLLEAYSHAILNSDF